MPVNHSLFHSFLDQLTANSWTRTNLRWSDFRITVHIHVFKIQQCFLDKYSEPATCVTTLGVECSPTTLPQGPDKMCWARTYTTWTASFERHVLCACYTVALATGAEVLELPTSSLPVMSFYHRIWLQYHCRSEINVDFATHLHFLDTNLGVKTNLEMSFVVQN